MSETTRLSPRDFRRQAFALMKQCWLTLLIAALLMSLPSWFADWATSYGETAADRIEQAVFAEFEAANPRPEDPAALEQWETERIAHAYFSSADINGARAERQWRLIGYVIDLLGALFSAVISAGLYTGFLACLRGGTGPIRIFAGFRRWKTALWLKIRITACIYGWLLLFIIPVFMLPAMIGLILLIPVGLWAQLHYALVLPHMADDPDDQFTTTQYLDAGVEDMRFLTVWGLIRVLWPIFLVALVSLALTMSTAWLPWLDIPAAVFTMVAELFTTMAGCACIICTYEELRRCRLTQETIPAVKDQAE